MLPRITSCSGTNSLSPAGTSGFERDPLLRTTAGTLDARVRGDAAFRIVQQERERGGEIREEREMDVPDRRPSGVTRGRDLGLEIMAGLFALGGREIVPVAEVDAVARRGRGRAASRKHSAWRARLRSRRSRTCWSSAAAVPGRRRAAAQDGDALHEELVQIGGEDGEKLGALQQWIARIQGFGEDAIVEVQPAQIAIDPNLGKRLRRPPGSRTPSSPIDTIAVAALMIWSPDKKFSRE